MLTFTLSQQDYGTVMRALGLMPLNESLQAFMNLQRQLADQQASQQRAAGIPPMVQPPAPPLPNGEDH